MSNSNSSATGGGVSFFGLLTVAFVVLKLTEHIDWSWWWVFAPLWIPVAIVLFVVIVLGVAWGLKDRS